MPGTVTETAYTAGHIRRVSFTCTADAAAATYPATTLTHKIDGKLLKLVTNPGAVQPTDNYDITITDQNGIDVLQGVGANRDTLNSEEAAIVYSGTNVQPCVSFGDTLTLNVSGNSVNSAVTVIDLYYRLGG